VGRPRVIIGRGMLNSFRVLRKDGVVRGILVGLGFVGALGREKGHYFSFLLLFAMPRALKS
jgi:hypothetical protein